MRRGLILIAAGVAAALGCMTEGGRAWVEGAEDPSSEQARRGGADVLPLTYSDPPVDPAQAGFPPLPEEGACDAGAECSSEPIEVKDYGSGPRAIIPDSLPADLFRNTYYDFPSEGTGKKDAKIFDASCKVIAEVPREFHDKVCVQGSGKLASGRTVSFAKRGCDCADVCPRTGFKICFEALDPAKYPSGRGATGKPITPLKTVAVDSSVIPLGTPVFIADYVGVPRPDGSKHDGCFLAEDRGTRVIGRQIDIFTGDPSVTALWNKSVPSNRGVRVSVNDPRCPKAP
jgi:3D (Asp-Asp-Asp) domain-containing protein